MWVFSNNTYKTGLVNGHGFWYLYPDIYGGYRRISAGILNSVSLYNPYPCIKLLPEGDRTLPDFARVRGPNKGFFAILGLFLDWINTEKVYFSLKMRNFLLKSSINLFLKNVTLANMYLLA